MLTSQQHPRAVIAVTVTFLEMPHKDVLTPSDHGVIMSPAKQQHCCSNSLRYLDCTVHDLQRCSL